MTTKEKEEEDRDIVEYVDIGINVTSKQMRKRWKGIVKRAVEEGVTRIVLTGTSLACSRKNQDIIDEWELISKKGKLFCTVGIHPHDAKTFVVEKNETIEEMKKLIARRKQIVCAVGECGLDYNRMFSTKEEQLRAFREQVKLACELSLPIFVHEREAHEDLVSVLDTFPKLPPVVVHCFTGSLEEAKRYVDMGFHIGFTGTICKFKRGEALRNIVTKLPLDRIMIETDAPWMGFVKGRRFSEPADVALVAKKISSLLGITPQQFARTTTTTARRFFRLP